MAALVRECRRVSTRTITVVALLLAVLVPLGIGVARSITAGAARVAPHYGDVFVANASTSTVVQYDHYNAGSGGSPTVLGTVGTGLNRPTGVAVGPNGHVYIADSGNARVLDVAPDGTQTTIGRNWVEPYAVAADIVGNVYVADISAQRVAKISPTGFQTYIARSDTNPGDDFTNPQALAVDQSGNVYIAAARDGGGIVLEVTPTGTKSTLFRSDFIRGLAVDAAGDLYLTTDPYLAVLHPGDSAPTNLYTRPLDGFALESMAIDASGNLYTTTGSGLRQGIQWFATNRNPLAPRTWLDGGNGGPIGIAVFEWPPAFPTDGAVPPDGTVGVPYATRDGIPQDPSGSFGANKVTVASGTLPPGLKLACNAGCFVLAGTPTAAGTYTFTLQSANQQGAILGEPMTITIGKGTATLAVDAPAAATFGDPPAAVTATSNATGAITWSTTGPCAYDAGAVSFSGAGDCVVTATQAADDDYLEATASATIVVAKGTPTQTLSAPSNAAYGDAPVAVSLTSSSTSAVSWSTTGPCAYDAGKVSFTGVGDCVVTADQAADADYVAASTSATIVVAKGDPGLSVTAPSAATFGDAPVAVSATSSSTGDITWSTDGPCAYSSGKVSFSGAGSCIVTADQVADANYLADTSSATIDVAKRAPGLVVTAPSAATFGDAPVAVSASSASSGAITWSTDGPCAYSAGKVSFSGAGDCVVTADQAATTDDLADSASSTIVVAKAAPVLSLTVPASATFGDAPVGVSASSASSGAITWSTDGPCAYSAGKVSFSGAGDCVVAADQAATADYTTATGSSTIVVAKAVPTLQVTAPASATFGDAAVAVSASSESSGTITWSTSGPCAYAAGKVSFSGAGDCVVTADQAAASDYAATSASSTIVVAKAVPTLQVTAPASATFGDAAVAVSASSESSGTITWSTSGPAPTPRARSRSPAPATAW
ncbi:MAG: NHL repeat-containing protein [Acidimicrobiales bacterium]